MVSRQPSDDAILAMLGAARQSIRLVIQDLGPVCIPGTKITLPGSTWPHEYLSVLARAVWSKDVVVEIIVSNPLSIPDHVGVHQGVYGNGWSTEDVCAEILKKIRKHFPDADRNALREKLQEKLRVCYLRGEHGRTYEDGTRMALHSKHFIVDEQACYIGSQNLYVCDLAEWGVIIDHAVTVKQIMSEYWWPMWVRSFSEEDREIDVILDAMEIDRDGEDPDNLSAEMSKVFEEADRQFGQSVFGKSIKNFAQEGNIFTPDDIENYHIGEMIEDEE